MNRLFACTVLLLATSPALAADPNGYTAQYECRAGNPACDVDIVSLTKRPCDQIVSVSTQWSAINWDATTICLEAGDHTSKGPLTIRVSGSPSSRKVLRYYRAGDSDDDPWKQNVATQARLFRLVMVGADYWVIHRLTLDPGAGSSAIALEFNKGSQATHNVISRILAQNGGADDNGVVTIQDNNHSNVVQNSVIRNGRVAPGQDNNCLAIFDSHYTRIVNNEAYDCTRVFYTMGAFEAAKGTVFENNDIYFSPAFHTDCSGRSDSSGNGPCSKGEAVISQKAGGTRADPVRWIRNRIWGGRFSDTTVCCLGGSSGAAMTISTQDGLGWDGADYVLVQNNIISDSQYGIDNYWGDPDHASIIGNVFYNNRKYYNGWSTASITIGGAYGGLRDSEVYFNTFINSEGPWFTGSQPNWDIRCNVVINSAKANFSGSATEVDSNAFYNTPPSGSNPLSYASAADSRGDGLTFYRRLKTGPEQVTIPHARPTPNSPHTSACPSTTGLRQGVGVADDGVL